MVELKETYLYDVYFDAVSPASEHSDDDYYDEVIYYDGGEIEEDSGKTDAYFMVKKKSNE